MSEKIKVAIAGLGGRGRQTYAECSKRFADEMEIVAVADIVPEKVREAAQTFGVAPELCFESAEALLEKERLADVLFICTPDRCHELQAVAALDKGYHLLLEKPIAPELDGCRRVLEAARRNHRHVVVCHVLRYTPFYRKIKELLEGGAVGEIVTVQAIENVGYYHQAHSFVRGNWRNSKESSPMILQKCCHDMDILLWLTGKRLQAMSSYGGLYLFRPEKAPEGATDYCLGGCKAKEGCVYDAEKIYITDKLTGVRHTKGWPANLVALEPTEENVYAALKDGPYGRCVYRCDNDVVDHQVVNLALEDGVTVSFTMSGVTSVQYRHMKIMGTLGDIDADMDTNLIKVTPFGGEPEIIDIGALAEDLEGHAGGDHRMLGELLQLLRGEYKGSALSSIEQSMESHFASLGSEYSRLHGGENVTMESLLKG